MGILQSATLHDTRADDGLNILRLECPSRSSTEKRRSAQTNTVNEDRVINSASNCAPASSTSNDVPATGSAATGALPAPRDETQRATLFDVSRLSPLMLLIKFSSVQCEHQSLTGLIQITLGDSLFFLRVYIHLSGTDILEELRISGTRMDVFSHLDNVITHFINNKLTNETYLLALTYFCFAEVL